MPETALLRFFFFQHSIQRTGATTPGLYIPGTTVLNHNARPAQISPAIYSSAAPCGAVCLALRCYVVPRCAVLCCAFVLSFEHTATSGICVVYFFAFSSVDLSLSPCFFPNANYTCTVTANKRTAHHSKGQFALHKQLLALSIRCSHQIMRFLFLPPLHV